MTKDMLKDFSTYIGDKGIKDGMLFPHIAIQYAKAGDFAVTKAGLVKPNSIIVTKGPKETLNGVYMAMMMRDYSPLNDSAEWMKLGVALDIAANEPCHVIAVRKHLVKEYSGVCYACMQTYRGEWFWLRDMTNVLAMANIQRWEPSPKKKKLS
jgi:hypothetical protein